MSEQITRRFRATLAQEIARWQDDDVISPDVAAKLTAMYPVPASDSKLIMISLIVGSSLLGLAWLLFIGSNSVEMSRVLKLTLCVAGMLASYIGTWHWSYEPGNAPKLGSALQLLGTMFFGGCIFLITQSLNFDANLTQSLLFWMLGTAALTFVTRSQISCCLVALQMVAWQIALAGKDIFSYGSSQTYVPLAYYLPALVIGLLLAARVRSRVASYLMLAGAMWLIGIATGTHWAGFVVLGSIMCSTYFLLRDQWEWFAESFLYIGAGGAMFGAFTLTMDMSSSLTLNVDNLGILLGVATMPGLFLGIARKANQIGASISFLMALLYASSVYFLRSCGTGGEITLVLSMVVLALTMLVLLVVAGIKLEKLLLTYSALAIAALQIAVRYFGFQIDSMYMRSVIFAGAGAILLCIGAIAERKRRKYMVQTIH